MTDSAILERVFSEADIASVRKPLEQATVIPTFCYSDPSYHEQEVENVLMRSWLPAGRIDQVANPGDYFTRSFFGESVIIVRGKDDKVRALSNVCRHRASQVVDDGAGNSPLLICPYHKWTYNLDGGLKGAPYMNEAEDFEPQNCRLPEFPVEIWNGFIFINFDTEAEPLAPQLEPLTEAMAPFDMASMKTIPFKTLSCNWNWKASMENFTEAYHHIGIHPESVQPYMPAKSVIYEDSNNAYSLFWMPTADKKPMPSALPDIPGMPEEYYYSKGVANVYPFLHLLISSNIILWLDFDVSSVDRHDLVWHVMMPASTLELPDFEERYAPWVERMTGVVGEDEYACTKASIGQRSRFYTPGRISHMEKCIHQMHNWLLDMFDSSSGSMDSPR